MPAAEWKHLGMIAERLGQLAHRAEAAAATGDVALAAYFRQQARQADRDRQRIVDRLFGEVCETV
jgi:hypothetical protein